MNYIKFLVFISFLLFSCNSNKKGVKAQESTDSISLSKERVTSAPAILLEQKPAGEISKWKHYQKASELIKSYYNITVYEALKNAPELVNLTEKLKDSIQIEKLETPGIKARLNVLHNEALRLQDMSKIPSITDEEVKQEVQKMLKIYSAINSKINSIYRIEEYEIDIN